MTAPRLLWALLAVGAVTRALALWLGPDLHPDSFFQYIEPAWWHWQGYGWPAWEWFAGLRSWIVPAYHGAWMVLLSWMGVTDVGVIHVALMAHWALVSLASIWAAWRIGWVLSGAHTVGAALAAAGVALSPVYSMFSPQTLSEVMSVPLLLLGLALWVEKRGMALAGALLALGACVRVPHAPVAVVVGACLFLSGRWRALGQLLLGAAPVVLLFGAVDFWTWGKWWHSAWQILNYNVLEGRAVEHGVQPKYWYALRVWEHFEWLLPLWLSPLVIGFRRVWRMVIPATIIFALLSSQAHQEDRYAVLVGPCLWIAWGAALGAWVARLREGRWRNLACAACAGFVGLAAVQSVRAIVNRPTLDYSRRWGLYRGQTWCGRWPALTGALVEGRFHLSGGYSRLGRNVPLASFSPWLLGNRLFNCAVVREASPEREAAVRAGFVRAHQDSGFEVMTRPSDLGVLPHR